MSRAVVIGGGIAGLATAALLAEEGHDVVLAGHGDARLSSAPDCRVDCLADLARAVAARTRVVHDVIGDDTAFPDERWPAGMSWNNMAGRYGTAISALTVDDDVVAVTVTPGTRNGAAATVVGDGSPSKARSLEKGASDGLGDVALNETEESSFPTGAKLYLILLALMVNVVIVCLPSSGSYRAL